MLNQELFFIIFAENQIRGYCGRLRIFCHYGRFRSTCRVPDAFDMFMHEVGIVESALELVGQHVAVQGARHVERIVLRIGTLAGVDPQSLQFAFEAISPGTVAEGAVLEIQRVATAVYCRKCQSEFEADGSFIFACPTCGDFSGEILRGRELELSRIEMT